METEKENQPTSNSLMNSLNVQREKLSVPLRFSEERKEAYKQKLVTLLNHWWLTQRHQYPADLQFVFQSAMDEFEVWLKKNNVSAARLEAIMIRLNKQLYHRFMMEFSESQESSAYVAFGKFFKPSHAEFDIDEVFDKAGEGFYKDLAV